MGLQKQLIGLENRAVSYCVKSGVAGKRITPWETWAVHLLATERIPMQTIWMDFKSFPHQRPIKRHLVYIFFSLLSSCGSGKKYLENHLHVSINKKDFWAEMYYLGGQLGWKIIALPWPQAPWYIFNVRVGYWVQAQAAKPVPGVPCPERHWA